MLNCVKQDMEEFKMTKNPYEVRLELLKMGKEMLDMQYAQYSTMAWEAFNKAAETNNELYKEVEKYLPKMFTPEEVINQAKKFQEFIDRKE